MSFQEWLRPPRVLFFALYLLFGISALAVIWLGQTLLERDQAQQARIEQQALERQADQFVTLLKARLLALQKDLVTGTPPRNGVLVWRDQGTIRVSPPGSLLYLPSDPPPVAHDAEFFRAAESLEFRSGDAAAAAEQYRKLTRSEDSTIRSGAWLRLARVSRKTGLPKAALLAYGHLAEETDVRLGGIPSELIARHARLDLLTPAERSAEVASLRTELAAAKWPLSQGQFEFFWEELGGGRLEQEPLSQAVLDSFAPGGKEDEFQILRSGGRRWLVVRKSSAADVSILLLPWEELLSDSPGLELTLTDARGWRLAGEARARSVFRSHVQSGLPWSIEMSPSGPSKDNRTRPWLLLSLVGVMLAFLGAGTYFVSRAIRREIEIVQLQSDFVSAVSHEFRSPLTTIRSLSEMLEAGRVIEENRPQYFHTLVQESVRLQRLVETLLQFGKMENREPALRFESVDAANLVGEVISSFRSSRDRIRADLESITVAGDRDALGAAVRNLIDNALKYSSEDEPVKVVLGRSGRDLRVSVSDQGAGVATEERQAIFGKFARGSAAISGNVRGTGVGLAMVRQIAEAHSGRVELESQLGKGSTFTLVVPLEQEKG